MFLAGNPSFILVRWLHSCPDDPIEIWSELDDRRFEVRKVEIWRDGRVGYAVGDVQVGGTGLGEIAVPPLDQIAADPEFEAQDISRFAFEDCWDRTGVADPPARRLERPPHPCSSRAMTDPADNPTIALLRRRRSVPPALLAAPGPSPAELDMILHVAARVPDHGKLAPWRFLVFEGEARDRAGAAIAEVFAADNPDASAARLESERKRLSLAPTVVAVVSRAVPHVKIPEWEQLMSAGAATMNLVVAANALGFATSWLTEWYSYDARVGGALGLAPGERIVGFVHIGRPTAEVEDRVRPVMAEVVSRF